MSTSISLNFWLVEHFDSCALEDLKSAFKRTANWITIAESPVKDVWIAICTIEKGSTTNHAIKILLNLTPFCLYRFHTIVKKLTSSAKKLTQDELAMVLKELMDRLEKQARKIFSSYKDPSLIKVDKEIQVFSQEITTGESLMKTLRRATEHNINIRFQVFYPLSNPSPQDEVCEQFVAEIEQFENISVRFALADLEAMSIVMKSWFRTILPQSRMELTLVFPSYNNGDSEIEISCLAERLRFEVQHNLTHGLICPCHQKLVQPSRCTELNCVVDGTAVKKENCVEDSCSVQLNNHAIFKLSNFSSWGRELMKEGGLGGRLRVLDRVARDKLPSNKYISSPFLISCCEIDIELKDNFEMFIALCQKVLENNEGFVASGGIDMTSGESLNVPIYYVLLPILEGKYFIARKLANEEQTLLTSFPSSSTQQQIVSSNILDKAAEILAKLPKQQDTRFLPRTLEIHNVVEKLMFESLPHKRRKGTMKTRTSTKDKDSTN